MIREIFTIGVYGTSETSFFAAPSRHNISRFVDIRRRCGMRGGRYAYANSTALKSRLREMGIAYERRLDLAPTKDIRSVENKADSVRNTTKSSRAGLSPEFVAQNESECLAGFDAAGFLDRYPPDARIVLFCLEARTTACHRSTLAECIRRERGLTRRDITPGGTS
ncbi:MAG: DUF488 family protein [Fimbriimonadaceae bacterium]